jgi:hypothetical protein
VRAMRNPLGSFIVLLVLLLLLLLLLAVMQAEVDRQAVRQADED